MNILSEEYQLVVPGTIKEHPENPRKGNEKVIAESLDAHGFYGAVVVQRSTGYILVGNHRHRMMTKAGADLIPVIWVDVDDEQARRILLADNRTADLAGWDEETLAALLRSMPSYLGTGFSDDAVAKFLQGLVRSDGSLLSLVDVTIADPTHKVEDGDVWRIERHTLVCTDVITGWPVWAPLLTPGALFIPYPGPYTALSDKAAHETLVLVQPDRYLAGHLLDKYTAVRGRDAVVKA